MTSADEEEAAAVRKIWSALGLPGLIDVHTHFMPKSVLDQVWNYFDSAGPLVGRERPISYRAEQSRRVRTLREFGVRAFTALVYPHKPKMAAWLNDWAAEFSLETPECLATATFYPEPEAYDYVEVAIRRGTRIFKAHIQVGRYDPNDPLLERVWGTIEDAGCAGGDPLRLRTSAGRAHRPGTHSPPTAPLPATPTGHRTHGNAGIRGIP